MKKFPAILLILPILLLMTGCRDQARLDRLEQENAELRAALSSQQEVSSKVTADTNHAVSDASQGATTQALSSAERTNDLVDCWECYGTGFFNACGACDGAGVRTVSGKMSKCDNCGGTGKNKCFNCNGTGKVTAAKRAAASTYSWKPSQSQSAVQQQTVSQRAAVYSRQPVTPIQPNAPRDCTYCHGSGKKQCPFCKGAKVLTQKKAAPNYGGGPTRYYTERTTCYHCHGTGYEKCLYCGGDGKLGA